MEGQGLHHEQEQGNGLASVKRKHVLYGFAQSPWGESVDPRWFIHGFCIGVATSA